MKIQKMCLAISMAVCSVSAFAQEQEVKNVEFNPHSYLQLQGGAGWTLGEAEFTDLISPAAAFSFGYQFSPVIGARIGVSGWESRGGWVNPDINYKYNYLAGNLDVVFNMSNLISGFNPKRVFNLNLFAGGAVNYAFNNDEAEDLAKILRKEFYAMPYLWHESKVLVAGRMGVIADFRLSERFSLNLEANANVLSDRYNSKRANNADWHFNLLAGVSFRLGKPTKTVASPVVSLPIEVAPVKEEKPIEKPVEVKKQVEELVEKPVEEYRCEVFFALNSSVIESDEEQKVSALAEFLKQHAAAKVEITGYADVKTGNVDINMRLSKERAGKVAELLTSKYGIEANRIKISYKGDSEQPFDVNEKNRVCICWTQQ